MRLWHKREFKIYDAMVAKTPLKSLSIFFVIMSVRLTHCFRYNWTLRSAVEVNSENKGFIFVCVRTFHQNHNCGNFTLLFCSSLRVAVASSQKKIVFPLEGG